MVRRPSSLALALIGLSLAGGVAVTASVIGDGPVIRKHVDQQLIDSGELSLKQIMDFGKLLFVAKFNTFDGQGRPGTTGGGAARVSGSAPAFIRTSAPESNSCAGCHNDPAPGGSGDIVANVFVLAQTLDPVTSSVDSEFSDERNTLGMNGSGLIEMLAREMTVALQGIRDNARTTAMTTGIAVTRPLTAKGVSFGSITALPDGTVKTDAVEGIDADLVLRPFHQKGVVVSLREFTNNAFNHHHGMQSVERFGAARTGTSDFDQDGVPDELTIGDITATTIWQATLGTPGQVIPDDGDVARAIIRGERTFSNIGCASCHVPEMRLDSPLFSEPNPFNPAGNLRPADVPHPFTFNLATAGALPRPDHTADGKIVVRAFTDLKRHDLCDAQTMHLCNEKVVQAGVSTRQFLTRKLWDCGSSAPWGHRGDITTLTEMIQVHGGEAASARAGFNSLPKSDRDDVIEFLKSLQVLPDSSPSLVVNELAHPVDKVALVRAVLGSRARPTRH